MITFFTTTKPFDGKNLTNQVNAIKSWTIGNRYGCEVIVFQRAPGIDSLTGIPNLRIIDDVRSNERGVPYISEMFVKASEIASNDILCFINADIVLSNSFVGKLRNIHDSLEERYLVVGQRLDVSCNFLIDFNNSDWFENLINSVNATAKVHPPYGSDFFCFPRGQYHDGSLPDLLVGRPGWDLYMIYDTRKKRYRLVDMSDSEMVLHQNHDYEHKSRNPEQRLGEDSYNLDFLPKNGKYKYLLNYCNYLYLNDRLVKSYHRGDLKKYYAQEVTLYNLSLFSKLLLKIRIFLMSLWLKSFQK